MANLAAYMSNFKEDFVSDGAGNWALRAPASAPAD